MEEIEIRIAGNNFTMKVDSSKVELYRVAEQRLRESLIELERKSYEGISSRELISLVAFEYVLANVNLLQKTALAGDETTHLLTELNNKIDTYLNDPTKV